MYFIRSGNAKVDIYKYFKTVFIPGSSRLQDQFKILNLLADRKKKRFSVIKKKLINVLQRHAKNLLQLSFLYECDEVCLWHDLNKVSKLFAF